MLCYLQFCVCLLFFSLLPALFLCIIDKKKGLFATWREKEMEGKEVIKEGTSLRKEKDV